ncbi:MAG: hypothetical protein AABY14_02795 [Nanoarchaeota archaeon]
MDTQPPEIAVTSITNEKGEALIKEGEVYKTKETRIVIKGEIVSEETTLPIIYEEATPSNKAVVTQDKKFSITLSLQSGKQVILTVQDANNKNLVNRVTVNAVLDTQAPEIKITEPLNLVSNLRQPTIKVEVDNNEDAKCSISYNLPPQVDSELEPKDFAREFTYKFQYITSGELAFSINCADRLGNENRIDYKIKIDELKPIISKIMAINANEISPGQFLIIQPAVTSLEITTNELARCKYGATAVYEDMNKFPDFDDITKAYKTTLNSETINLESVKGIQQTYNLICEDKAGLLSAISTIKVTYNPDAGVIISELTPTITNIKRPTIRAKTDVQAKCSIDRAYPGIEGFLFDILDPPKEMYSSNGIEHNYPNNANEWKEDFKDAGVYNFDITCIDTQNSARKPGSAVHSLKTDFTIPVKPLITSPTNNAKVSQRDITIIGSVAEAELIVKINFNGKETVITSDKLIQDGDKYTFTLPTQLADGENRIYAVAYDQANNPSDDSITDSEITKVYYIISAPTIRAIIPSETVKEANKIEISYNLIQDVAIKDVILKLTRTYKDGNEDKTEDITTTKQFTDELKNNVVFDPENYDKLPDGKYTLEVSVEDTLGNKNTETKEFTVDPRVPSITITEPVLAPVIRTRENTFKIKGTVTDTVYQLTSVILGLNNQDINIQLSQDKHSANIDTTLNLIDGENTIIIKATNQISQQNTATLEFVVVVDKTVEGGEILIE